MTDDRPHSDLDPVLRDVIERAMGDPAEELPTVVGRTGWLPSALPVEDAAAATVAAALAAATRLGADTAGRRQVVGIDREHVAAAFRSEAYVRLDCAAVGGGFAPLSRFWPTADGWVRTHANYEWHRQALLQTLDIDDAAGEPETVAQVLAEMSSRDVEDRVTAAGGIAVAVRTPTEWLRTEQGAAAAARPLIRGTALGYAAPRRPATPGLPAAGVRVLDLTRVIAGPVGTRFLAALGADVLRLDPPALPELPLHIVDGLVGKRSALLDAGESEGLATLHELLDQADIVVHGYRPGALDRFGLDAGSLAERHPGLVSVALSAWGDEGPWAHRRGFDSIVQAASGISMIESAGDGRPGALPCQLLDHGTGYLVAAAALDGLFRQRTTGGTQLRSLALATTASWVLRLPAVEPVDLLDVLDLDTTHWSTTIDRLTAIRPPGTLDGQSLSWPSGLPSYGADAPAW
jgi:crotonobetainyl-CoA:carnitine CoA-transferase CaiB-like acyl-CoA transferase